MHAVYTCSNHLLFNAKNHIKLNVAHFYYGNADHYLIFLCVKVLPQNAFIPLQLIYFTERRVDLRNLLD